MKVQILLLATILISGCAISDGQFSQSQIASFGEILVSTLKIVRRLCHFPENRNNQEKINEFFACYDQAPGKDLFVACQSELFGGPLNTVANVGTSCSQPRKLATYSTCLSDKFRAAGLDMNSAVITLNACQSAVLGITA